MKLVLREYLSMLKESGELDALIYDLILAMGLEPLSRPTIGTRQFGVDIAAAGIDLQDETKTRKLFLITIKKGDISRRDWDTGIQAVRPSLNEIRDSYLRNRVRPEHKQLPKKIVLATGGELKQEVEPDWVNYVHRHSAIDAEYGPIEFEFWGADKLALMIERNFLQEYLFPESAQKKIRKTIALADQNESDPQHFYDLIEQILFVEGVPYDNSRGARRKRQGILRLINLSLNIVFHWCQEADNLRPAHLCAERTVLRTWDWMRHKNLFECTPTLEEYIRLFATYLKIVKSYVSKLQPFCMVRDGLYGHGADELGYSLRTFDLIGVLGSLGMTIIYLTVRSSDDQIRQRYYEEAVAVSKTLSALIRNNPSALTPRFDGHSVDISLGLLLLIHTKQFNQAVHWLDELGSRINFAYQIGRDFPVSSDSYEDLVAMKFGQAPPKEKLMELSTLLPMLAEWYVVLDHTEGYEKFQNAISETFEQTNLQIWYPDDTTDSQLYQSNAGKMSGAMLTSIKLPQALSDLREKILRVQQEHQAFEGLSCITKGWPMLGLIASRHFRTPVMPSFWQQIISEPQQDNDNSSSQENS